LLLPGEPGAEVLKQEGLFRKSGNHTQIQDMKQRIDKGTHCARFSDKPALVWVMTLMNVCVCV
jgi:hypothetical protein